jgi:hypothetical protein
MRIRQRSRAVRTGVWLALSAIGVCAGFVVGIGAITLDVAVFGHSEGHTLHQLVVVGAAYLITGVTGLAVASLTWRRLFH